MRPPFDIIADLDTPVSAFLKLGPLQPRFLLESVVGGEQVGRYSLIGFGEVLEVRLDGELLSVGDQTRHVGQSQAELLDALRWAAAQAPDLTAGLPLPVPFEGGLVGLTSYDIVRRFEQLPDLRGRQVRDDPDARYLAPKSMLIFDHASRRAAVLHAGPESERRALRAEVVRRLNGPTPLRASPGRHTPPKASLDQAAYEDGVRKTIAAITEGEVYQLVQASQFSGQTDHDPFQVYRALRLLNPSPYMYFCDFGDQQIIGSSPEALVKLDGRRATLRPIAGTRPRGADRATDLALELELLADPKEAAEHVMLVDLARNDLGRVAVPGSIVVDPYRTIERYSHVMHIVSGVEGELREGYDAFDLFAATFPAGTVVGAPKIRAMQIIESLEPVHRGAYAGTVGYFGRGGRMDQAIAIRTLVLGGGRYRYGVGAGLVADSVPAREHAEIMAKGAALGAALELAGEVG